MTLLTYSLVTILVKRGDLWGSLWLVLVASTDCWFIFHHILLTADTSNINFTKNILKPFNLTVKKVKNQKKIENISTLNKPLQGMAPTFSPLKECPSNSF